jgi:serine/threonine protein kinase
MLFGYGLSSFSEPIRNPDKKLAGNVLIIQQLKSIVYQILETLIYIHKKKICHRDIKP